jgi:copper chaperone CopZ
MFQKIILFSLLFVCRFTADAQYKSATLQALGLTCAMCSNAITKSLKTIPFVEEVKPDLEKVTYELKFKEGADINFDLIRKKVEDAGFTVGSLILTAEFSNTKVSNNQLVMFGGKVLHFVGVDNQMLNGEQKIRIINKYFVPLKDYKKFQALSSSEVLKTEKAGANGKELGTAAETRVYNVTI